MITSERGPGTIVKHREAHKLLYWCLEPFSNIMTRMSRRDFLKLIGAGAIALTSYLPDIKIVGKYRNSSRIDKYRNLAECILFGYPSSSTVTIITISSYSMILLVVIL